jgi:putative NIF3 family GTP cyclohydrolase 1 type 2
MSLFAYHLPLDCHPEYGNNATLGRLMGVSAPEPLDHEHATTPLFKGFLDQPIALQALAGRLEASLSRAPLVVGDGNVQSIVWCTGAGQGYIDLAADAGADVYVTGEVSEQTVHIARERNIAFIAAGHHATERYGVQAVGALAADTLGCTHEFIEIANPV